MTNIFYKYCGSIMTFTLVWVHIVSVNAQITNSDSASADNSSVELNNYFLIDISYTNNDLSKGNNQTSSSSAVLGDISFYHKSGIWASLMPTMYSSSPVVSYDIDGQFGYQYFFNNGFDINLYYGYHSYKGDSAFWGINYQHNFNSSVGYSIKDLYFYVDAYSLHGTSDNYFGDLGIGFYKEFSFRKVSFSFFPMASLAFGTDYWIMDDFTNSDYRTTLNLVPQDGYELKTFDMQSIDFMLPLSLSFNNFTLSISYLYSLPTNKYKLLGWENQSGVFLSLNYILNLKK